MSLLHPQENKLVKSQIILNSIYSVLGTDINNIEASMGPEMEVNDEDVYSGLLAYYVARPYTNGVARSTMLLQTNFDIDLNISKPSLSDEWHFLGIVSEGRKFNLTSNLLDQRLTGIPLK